MSAGSFHSCGLRADQTVTCWGGGFQGQTDAPMLRFLDRADSPGSASVLLPRAVGCQQQTTSAGKPGPPDGVQIVRLDLIGHNGHAAQPATVGWANPCSGGSADHYVVQWRRGHEDFGTERQRIVQSADPANAHWHEIPDQFAYAVRVIAVNRQGESPSPEVVVPTPANEVRSLLYEVVATFGGRYPWLREVGARMSQPDFNAFASYCGPTFSGCAQSSWISIVNIGSDPSSLDEQEARRQGWTPDLLKEGATAVHEMAHVYHDLTDLAVNPAAIAAGRVYLNDFLDGIGVVQEGYCRTTELYADIPGMLMSIDGLRRFGTAAYWVSCRKQGRSLNSWLGDSSRSQELTEVMRSIYVDQEVPQWFYDTYQRTDGSWDVEAIKATLGYYADPSRSNSTYWQLRQLIPDL